MLLHLGLPDLARVLDPFFLVMSNVVDQRLPSALVVLTPQGLLAVATMKMLQYDARVSQFYKELALAELDRVMKLQPL